MQCGEYYCVGGTTHNDLLFWGTRFKNPPRLDDSWNLSSRGSSNAKDLRVESAGSAKSNSSVNSVKDMGGRDGGTSGEGAKDGSGK